MKKNYLFALVLWAILFSTGIYAQSNCCVNGKCEPGEKYPTCPDCPCYNNMDSTGAARPFFYNSSGGFINKTTAEANGMCYIIPASDLPGTFCFTYRHPPSNLNIMDIHVTPLGCPGGSSTTSNDQMTNGGCSSGNNTSNNVKNWKTYDGHCKFKVNGLQIGVGCPGGGYQPDSLYVVCVDITAAGCTGVEICPIMNCFNGNCGPPIKCIITPTVTATPTCQGKSEGVATLAFCDPTSSYTFLWDDPAAQTTAVANNLSAGTYHVTVTNSLSCNSIFTVVVPSIVCKGISISSKTICKGDCDTITPSILNLSPPYSIYWSDGYSTLGLHTICPKTTTTYTVTVKDGGGVTYSASATVTVLTTNVIASNDTSICPNDSALLKATGAISYVWSPATGLSSTTIANPIAKPSAAGTYYYIVTGTTASGCKGKDTVKVTVLSLIPTADAGPDITICPILGDSVIILTATGGNIFTWSTGQITQSIIVRPTETTTYYVTVKNTCGSGIAKDAVTVTVQCGVEIPNVFTPNGDKDNQYFAINNIDAYPNTGLEIYDRWGLKMYESSNYINEWQGDNYKTNKPVPDGIYYFILSHPQLNKGKPITGFVMIIRG